VSCVLRRSKTGMTSKNRPAKTKGSIDTPTARGNGAGCTVRTCRQVVNEQMPRVRCDRKCTNDVYHRLVLSPSSRSFASRSYIERKKEKKRTCSIIPLGDAPSFSVLIGYQPRAIEQLIRATFLSLSLLLTM